MYNVIKYCVQKNRFFQLFNISKQAKCDIKLKGHLKKELNSFYLLKIK